MSPDDVKALRKTLACTARELGATLQLPQETIVAWERGELFPTKRHVDAMRALEQRGPSAIVRTSKRSEAKPPLALLAEPGVWALFRKILAHPELRAQVERLANDFDDPAAR